MQLKIHDSASFREMGAQQLEGRPSAAASMRAFVGLDGFVDEIIHAVDKRDSAENFSRIPSITRLAERIASAAGRSTNVELVTQMTKLGGNGPIMANALASFGIQVTYLGALGYPNLHPVFHDFSERAEVVSICEAGHTDALEFEDGKIMLGKTTQLNEITWPNIQARYGRKEFTYKFGTSELVAFVNWTMIPQMSAIWSCLQKELCPGLEGPRRLIFIDLADPEKRTREDILEALQLIRGFSRFFDVALGLNEKEAYEIAKVLNLPEGDHTPEGLGKLSHAILKHVPIETLVVHPVSYALAVSRDSVDIVTGPFIAKPKITTGAGDHFNSGFCLGKLLGLENALCVLAGVATSGFYVRNAKSPTIPDLVGLMRQWPQQP